MKIDRRGFLALAAACLVAPSSRPSGLPAATRYLGARVGSNGRYDLSAFDRDGTNALVLPLQGRGHAAATRPGGHEAVLVARRPGRFLVVVDVLGGRVLRELEAAPGRHFCGHGSFSGDGRLFYTTENDFDQGQGVIGVRDVEGDYRQVAEWPSHGIDPHELLLGRDGRTLIVANGGILTHPDTGRTKLNLDTMEPSLVYLDPRDGRLFAVHRLAPERHQLSIRHLAQGQDGTVCVALQFEGPAVRRPPLVAFQGPGQAMELAEAPSEVQTAMRNYCGSVAADPSGDWFAVSSPRGNLVTFWGADGRFQGSTQVTDGCGVAPGDAPGTFFISSGTGTLHRHDCMTGATARLPGPPNEGIAWDNHLTLCA